MVKVWGDELILAQGLAILRDDQDESKVAKEVMPAWGWVVRDTAVKFLLDNYEEKELAGKQSLGGRCAMLIASWRKNDRLTTDADSLTLTLGQKACKVEQTRLALVESSLPSSQKDLVAFFKTFLKPSRKEDELSDAAIKTLDKFNKEILQDKDVYRTLVFATPCNFLLWGR